MNTKLTLTMEDFVIEKAKHYARQEGRSLSDLVENYLKAITSSTEIKEAELSPVVKSLRGSFKAPDDMDYKEELARRLLEKYLE